MSELPTFTELAVLSSASPTYVGVPSRLLAYYEQVKKYQRAALAPATLRAYASDFKAFVAFCQLGQVDHLPAIPETVACFLVYELEERKRRVVTLERRLAAIRFIHALQNLPSPTDHPKVTTTLAGIRNEVGMAPVRQKAALSVTELLAMIEACPNTPWGVRDSAILALGFSGAFRRSELAALQVEDLQFDAHGRLSCRVQRSKTDRAGKGDSKPIYNGRQVRAVDRLLTWLALAGIEDGPVFPKLDHNGDATRAALRPQWIGKIVQRVAKRAGMDPSVLGGHSLRAGFVTEAAEGGESLDAIMGVTLQRDPRTVLRYIRRAELWRKHPGKGFL